MSSLTTPDGAGTIPVGRSASRYRQAARAKEVRFCLAPIGFPWLVYEIATDPRLASPVSTDAVETCHPLGDYGVTVQLYGHLSVQMSVSANR